MYEQNYEQGNEGENYGGNNYGGNNYGGNNYGGNNYGANNYDDGYGGQQQGSAQPAASLANQSQRNAGPKRRGCGNCSQVFNRLKWPSFCGKEDLNCGMIKLLIGEFLGTFLLVFFGIGSVITATGVAEGKDGKSHKIFVLGTVTYALHVSFGFGIAVASIAQAIGHVSGCHLNPAVSFGLFAAGECSLLKAAFYSLAQIVGAICGAGTLKALTWSIVSLCPGTWKRNYCPDGYVGWHLGVSAKAEGINFGQAIVIEVILTFILVLVVCGVCDGGRKDIKGSAPLAIGFTVFLCHVVGIGLTGSSVNPARSIGPSLFSKFQDWEQLPIYIIGPLVGGILAGFLYNLIFRVDSRNDQVGPS